MSSQSSELENASVHFEQNATDGDVEVVFDIKGGDEGLVKLTVISPDGRTVVDFTAPDHSTLGIREFNFESPEPPDVERLKAAYPAGVYRFSGTTAAGAKLNGESTLTHQLPATASFIQPAPDATNVAISGLIISWTAVEDVAGYVVEIEQDELEVGLEVELSASSTTLSVPDGFLLPGTEYELSIGTVNEGNISFVETAFTTAE